MDLSLIVLQGFLTGIGLIMVIGTQNAFILRQGIMRNHVFLIATVSSLGDIFLITIGINGLGTFVQTSHMLQLFMVIAGSIFLFTYGGFAFKAAWEKQVLDVDLSAPPVVDRALKVILMALGFSILNPHAWLDAGIILGSIGGQLDSAAQRHCFTIGAIMASFVWFYTLAFAAWKLAPYLSKPRVWQTINIIVGLMMWGIAANLIYDYLYR